MTMHVATTDCRDGIGAKSSTGQLAKLADVQIVGIGSSHGDDQIGWLVADALAERIASLSIEHIASRRIRSPAQILDWLNGVQRLIVIDACFGLTAPGQILHCRWPTVEFDRLREGGSHDFSLWQTLAVAAQLQALPSQIDVWCVEGGQFESGRPLSQALSQAIWPAADAIWQTIVNP